LIVHILPLSKDPQPDEAEFNAFFPSKFSLSQFTSPKSDLADATIRNRIAVRDEF
jgi:molecular chaperone Hsp31 and glyoxalase 3